MTALASIQSAAMSPGTASSPLLGVGPFLRKELREWIRARRALVLFAVSTLMMGLSTLSARMSEAATRGGGVQIPQKVSFDPTFNVLAKWPEWIFFFAIVFSVNLFVVERDRGTLAWALSKPLSRTALMVGKWTAAMAMFTVFGVVLPMAACVVAASVAYGVPDLAVVTLATVLFLAVPVFFITVTLALATVLPSAPPVSGIAMAIAIAPGILGSFVPAVADVLPPTMGPWALAVAMGHPAGLLTPVGWFIGCVAAGLFGIAMLRRADL